MNKYIVKLKNRIFNSKVVVNAESFNYNMIGSTISFIDTEGKEVAMFGKYEIEYINKIK